MTPAEGVTKFTLTYRRVAPPPYALVAELIAWRKRLVGWGLVGQSPERYDGIGFGNLSRRHPGRPSAFIITGTQTGAMPTLGCHDFAVVTASDSGANTLTAHGGQPPSSEALTHAALYRSDARIDWVFHGHAPALWQAASRLGLPSTATEFAYGTPSMANAVSAIVRDHALPGVLIMGGHEDGVIAYGNSARRTAQLLQRQLQRAAQAI